MKPTDPSSNPSEQDPNEARVLAMLLGESDSKEQVAVEALLANDADLQAYRDQTALRLGLMKDATKGKAELETEPLRLDLERRGELEKLLASDTSRGEHEQEIEVVPFSPTDKTTKANSQKWTRFLPLASAAAVVALTALIARIAFYPIGEDYQGEENMAYTDEQSFQSHVTIETKKRDEHRQNNKFTTKKALEERVREKTVVNDIKLPMVSLDTASDSNSVIQSEGLNQLLLTSPRIVDEATESSDGILNRRLVDDIATLNDLADFDKNAFGIDRLESNDFKRKRGGTGGFANDDRATLDFRDSLSIRTASAEPAPSASPKPTIGSSGFRAEASSLLAKRQSEAVREPSGAPSTEKLLARSDKKKDAPFPGELPRSGKHENKESFSTLRSQLGKEEQESVESELGASLAKSEASSVFDEPIEGYIDEERLKAELDGKGDGVAPVDAGTSPPPLPAPPNPEISTTEQALSTFSPKVSEVSFRLAETSIKEGQWPAKSTIRSEDFVNALPTTILNLLEVKIWHSRWKELGIPSSKTVK
ncbi:MAG: hypothetical protein VB980_03570 [Opitutales bacterium]